MDENFRLFITSLPNKTFPLKLLQISTKVTNEPPSCLKTDILCSFPVIVDQDCLECVDTGAKEWKQLLFALLCFLHSIVQERYRPYLKFDLEQLWQGL